MKFPTVNIWKRNYTSYSSYKLLQ